MIAIQVKRNFSTKVDQPTLTRAAQMTLEFARIGENSDISIVIGNDEMLRKLNLAYRQVNEATDVLAFPSGEVDPDTHTKYLGDVIISLPRAQQQAAAHGHALLEELQLLVVHGMLHLLGYDHEQDDDKQKMQSAQERILRQLGVHLTATL